MSTAAILRAGTSGATFDGDPGDVLTLGSDGKASFQPGGGGGGGLQSFNGRTVPDVVPTTGDYSISQIGGSGATSGQVPQWSGTAWVPTTAAAGGVTSWNGRNGVVVPAPGDYNSTQITNASAVSGSTVTVALNTLASVIAALTIATTGPLAGGGVVQSGLTLSVADVSNTSKGVAPAITTGNGALLANAGGTSSSWALITSASWVGGLREVASVAARDAIPSGNRGVGMTVYEVDTDQLWRLIGGTANGNWVNVTIGLVSNTTQGLVPAVGSVSTLLQSTGTASNWVLPLTWDKTVANPTIQQAAQTANGTAGQKLSVLSQNSTGTTTTGGALDIGTGTGTTAAGALRLLLGSTAVQQMAAASSDFIALGAIPSSTGLVRLAAGVSIVSRDFTNAIDLNVYSSLTSGANVQTYGSASSASMSLVAGSSGINMTIGGAQRVSVSTTVFTVNLATLSMSGGFTSPQVFNVTNTTSTGTQSDLAMRAQGTTNAAGNGGVARVQGGRTGGGGAGLSGGVTLQINVDDTAANMQTMVGVYQLAAAQRVTGFNRLADLTTTIMPAGSGDGVSNFANATVSPTAAPLNGFTFFAKGGNLGVFTPNASKTSVGATGAATVLPALPVAYAPINYNGVDLCFPLYNP